jgi:SAM-dependent methyltransferase
MSYEPQVDPSHYQDLSYDRKDRFLSYWHQIEQILKRRPKRVLEVGIGNGFVHRYLRSAGVDVHTLDFDERLEPDTVGSVLELPFEAGAFDMTCCFETLEHLPWDVFVPAVRELKRVAGRFVLLSLPDVTPYVRVDIERSRKSVAHVLKDLPNRKPAEHHFDGQHYWEVGKRGYSVDHICSVLGDEGLKVDECFRVFEMPYHRFLSSSIP